MLAFGPVPSRRFGRSLGVNNVPPKCCSYACQYCQLGTTDCLTAKRRPFHPVRDLVDSVRVRVDECQASGQEVEYLTFVPDGEPTLDAHLGEEVRQLKPLGIPLAVITNGSLLRDPEVRSELAEVDVVSVKIDTAEPRTWRRLNRPERHLTLPTIIRGFEEFAWGFPGEVWTETMLVAGINDSLEGLERVAEVLQRVDPSRVYLSVPTRPPAVPSVEPASEELIVAAHEFLRERVARVELLTHLEEGSFGSGEDPARDLLNILAVHPMREETAREYLKGSGAEPSLLEGLQAEGAISSVDYRGKRFVVRWR